MSTVEEVLDFWLGPEADRDEPARGVTERWWAKDPEFDQALRARFGPTLERAAAGVLDSWMHTPRGRVALVIVLDQFTRNMFRDTPGMFANDERAVDLARAGLDRGEDHLLRIAERQFLYMPFMHAEDAALQQRCVVLFAQLAQESEGQRSSYEFACRHRDIVARFGRFPHRNGILGRTSTAEEIEFLSQPGSRF